MVLRCTYFSSAGQPRVACRTMCLLKRAEGGERGRKEALLEKNWGMDNGFIAEYVHQLML